MHTWCRVTIMLQSSFGSGSRRSVLSPATAPPHGCWLCGHHLCLLLCTQRCSCFLGLIYTVLSARCLSQPETVAPQVWMIVRSFLMQAPGLAQFGSFPVMLSMRCKQNRRSHILSATQSVRHTYEPAAAPWFRIIYFGHSPWPKIKHLWYAF